MENNVFTAFTTRWNGRANQLITDATILYNDKSFQVKALWDTGASASCVSPQVVNNLGMIATGKRTSHTASGTTIVNTYLASVILPNHVRVDNIVLMDAAIGNGFDAIIGMDIITMGDFSVSNFSGKTVLSMRIPSKQTTDYVMQINMENKGIKLGRRSKG